MLATQGTITITPTHIRIQKSHVDRMAQAFLQAGDQGVERALEGAKRGDYDLPASWGDTLLRKLFNAVSVSRDYIFTGNGTKIENSYWSATNAMFSFTSRRTRQTFLLAVYRRYQEMRRA